MPNDLNALAATFVTFVGITIVLPSVATPDLTPVTIVELLRS